MKRVLCLLLILSGLVFADLPKFEESGLLSAGGSLIDHIFPSPCVYDWDGDGIKDLIVGQFSSGKVNLYLNSGTNSSPELDASTFLKAGGTDITLSGS